MPPSNCTVCEIEITQRRQWEIGGEYGGRKRKNFTGKKNPRRETKTDRKQKKRETVPAPNRKPALTPAAWKLKPFKGFFSINATNTDCPDLSDKSPVSPLPSHYRFPTESKWENSILCFCSLRADKSFSDYWMRVGTPALLGYCISLYQNRCMCLVEHRQNRTQRKVGSWVKAETKRKNRKCSQPFRCNSCA